MIFREEDPNNWNNHNNKQQQIAKVSNNEQKHHSNIGSQDNSPALQNKSEPEKKYEGKGQFTSSGSYTFQVIEDVGSAEIAIAQQQLLKTNVTTQQKKEQKEQDLQDDQFQILQLQQEIEQNYQDKSLKSEEPISQNNNNNREIYSQEIDLYENQQDKDCRSMFTIMMNQCSIVVTKQDTSKIISDPAEWRDFIERYANRIGDIEESFIDFNSLINLNGTHQHLKMRKLIWDSKIQQTNIKDEALNSNFLDQNFKTVKISSEKKTKTFIAKHYNKIVVHTQKMLAKYGIIQNLNSSACKHGQKQSSLIFFLNYQQILQLILKVIISYLKIDEQIQLIRGLEYICYGIIVSYPIGEEQEQYSINIYRMFKYYMIYLNVRQLFLNGSPLYYDYVKTLKNQLSQRGKNISNMIPNANKQCKINQNNLFITYYKTLLCYDIIHLEIITKIHDLFLIYGMPIINFLLLKILMRTELKLCEFISDKQSIAQQIYQQIQKKIVIKYFEQALAQQKFKHQSKQMRQVIKIFQELIFSS